MDTPWINGIAILLQGAAFWRGARMARGFLGPWPYRALLMAAGGLLAGRAWSLAWNPGPGAWVELVASIAAAAVIWSLHPNPVVRPASERPEGSGRFPAEEQRQIAAHRLQMATRAARLGVWELDLRKETLIWDEVTRNQFGRVQEDQPVTLEAWANLVHPEEQAAFRQAFAATLRGEGDLDLRLRGLRPEGSVRHFRLVGHALEDQHGRIIRVLGVCQDFTHRVQADQSLLEAEKRFRTLIEKAPLAIAISRKGRFIYANPRYHELLGLPENETLVGKAILDHVAVEDRESFVRRATDREKGLPAAESYEVRALNREGKETALMAAVTRIELADGPATVGFFQDVSERRRAESAIKASQEQLQLILESTAEGLYGLDTEGRCTFINPAALRMLGYDRSENLLGQSMHALIHHSRRDGTPIPREECRIYQAFREGVGVEAEDEVYWRKDGSCFPVEYWSYPQRHGEELVGAVVGFLDRTRREQWEAENRRLNQFLESVIQNADVWLNVLDNDANVVLWNQAAARISGYSREEVIGHGRIWGWLYPDPEYLHVVAERAGAILRDGDPVRGFETTIRTKSGENRVIAWDSRALLGESGAVTGSIAIGRDITEAKLAEEHLKAAELQLRRISDTIPVMVYQLQCPTAEEWRFAFVNRRVQEFYGVSSQQALRDLPSTLDKVHPLDMERVVQSSREAIRTLSPWSLDFRVVVEGQVRWYHGESVPERLPSGDVMATGFFQDITERKVAEEQRERLLTELASKNKELETVVYVASHDLRSPLVNILGFSQRLERALKEMESLIHASPPEALPGQLEPILGERIPAALRFIKASGTKMDGLINGLLKVSRVGRAELNPEHLDMNALMRRVLDAMAFQIEQSEARVALGDLPGCLADSSQTGQAFSNLLDNAIKYRDPRRPLRITVDGELRDGEAVYWVEDTGQGIPAGEIGKIWTLFHRASLGDAVAGEGLGLALVQRLVERNGGRAWVESEPGQGSRFFIALPLG